MGPVTTWYMTEEERQAYIEKHPIKQIKIPKGTSLSPEATDYKWRGKKANAASQKSKK